MKNKKIKIVGISFIISILILIVVSARTYKDNIVSDNIELLVDSIEEKEIAILIRILIQQIIKCI